MLSTAAMAAGRRDRAPQTGKGAFAWITRLKHAGFAPLVATVAILPNFERRRAARMTRPGSRQ